MAFVLAHSARRLLHGGPRLKKVLPRQALLGRALLGLEHLGKKLRKEFVGKELLLRGHLLRRLLLRRRLFGRRLHRRPLFTRLGRALWLLLGLFAGFFHVQDGLFLSTVMQRRRERQRRVRVRAAGTETPPPSSSTCLFPGPGPSPAASADRGALRPRGPAASGSPPTPRHLVAPSFRKPTIFPAGLATQASPAGTRAERAAGAVAPAPSGSLPRTPSRPAGRPFPYLDLSRRLVPRRPLLQVRRCDLRSGRQTPRQGPICLEMDLRNSLSSPDIPPAATASAFFGMELCVASIYCNTCTSKPCFSCVPKVLCTMNISSMNVGENPLRKHRAL
ncbi:uncharacterized protein LOC121818353 [Ovis aries]|uniref:uncharacterized protein LOC121818353 n=1 Tax=Ovis aries TaxID=9940 RepID=UPI0029526B32|nr:uncharacterized protein LOC121818353 [Ovis aries]